MSEPADAYTVVSHEQDGRVLSGVGVSAEDLAATMDRHTPAETPPPAAPSSSAAPEAAPAPSAETDSAQPKPTRGQARFSELTQKAKDAIARAEAAERKAAELEARYAQQPPPQQTAQPQPQQEPPPRQPTRPEPTEDEVGTKYATYADFTRDQARWVWEQEQGNVQALIRQSIEADRAQQAMQSRVESTRAKGRAAYPDFDAVLASGPGGQVQIGPARCAFIYQHPQSEHLQYAIMKDAALAQRLASLSDMEFGIELSKLAPASPVASSASTGSVGSVTPPAPMQPVGSGSKTTVPPSAELAKRGFDFDASGYRERRAAERGVHRR